ncbi:uncharacterized protein LY79DRAFT_577138 [Colletotrichum navitas]|uniref:Uncharacterized protein n=1 Tax=Colletotrichum navitas TaxID=681940 RepID=A0AAD8V8Q4_9PEZI|nr:uncharacterized protein LY79DRAFT_577138 [Colletotrichum navitas]KAK1596538.1 hypothetical protein LY79DRAFT_577138 [Colletotrichum navitas]
MAKFEKRTWGGGTVCISGDKRTPQYGYKGRISVVCSPSVSLIPVARHKPLTGLASFWGPYLGTVCIRTVLLHSCRTLGSATSQPEHHQSTKVALVFAPNDVTMGPYFLHQIGRDPTARSSSLPACPPACHEYRYRQFHRGPRIDDDLSHFLSRVFSRLETTVCLPAYLPT